MNYTVVCISEPDCSVTLQAKDPKVGICMACHGSCFADSEEASSQPLRMCSDLQRGERKSGDGQVMAGFSQIFQGRPEIAKILVDELFLGSAADVSNLMP